VHFKYAASHQHQDELSDSAACHRPMHMTARRCGNHSPRLAVLDRQAINLLILCYSDTGATSAHSPRLSSFAVLPTQSQIEIDDYI